MPIVKDNDTLAQTFDPNVWPFRPVMPEHFVPDHESYIPIAAEGNPAREKAAFAALERRDQMAVERALFGKLRTNDPDCD